MSDNEKTASVFYTNIALRLKIKEAARKRGVTVSALLERVVSDAFEDIDTALLNVTFPNSRAPVRVKPDKPTVPQFNSAHGGRGSSMSTVAVDMYVKPSYERTLNGHVPQKLTGRAKRNQFVMKKSVPGDLSEKRALREMLQSAVVNTGGRVVEA